MKSKYLYKCAIANTHSLDVHRSAFKLDNNNLLCNLFESCIFGCIVSVLNYHKINPVILLDIYPLYSVANGNV